MSAHDSHFAFGFSLSTLEHSDERYCRPWCADAAIRSSAFVGLYVCGGAWARGWSVDGDGGLEKDRGASSGHHELWVGSCFGVQSALSAGWCVFLSFDFRAQWKNGLVGLELGREAQGQAAGRRRGEVSDSASLMASRPIAVS